MVLNDKIRILREMKNWTQEEMAEKMQMSKSGYSKIERGQSKMTTEKLEQIAAIFDVDVTELLSMGLNGTFNLIKENGNQSNYYGNSESLSYEIDKLKLMIAHQEELLKQKEIIIAQKETENALLKTLVETLQNKR